MTADWDADVVSVKAWAFRGDETKPMTERSWDISLCCVTGGLRVEATALHLSDLLHDSGILEPGDLAYRRLETAGSAEPRGLKTWRRVELDIWELVPVDGGSPFLIINPAGRRWTLRLTGATWRQVCVFAVAAVGHPWFEALRAP